MSNKILKYNFYVQTVACNIRIIFYGMFRRRWTVFMGSTMCADLFLTSFPCASYQLPLKLILRVRLRILRLNLRKLVLELTFREGDGMFSKTSNINQRTLHYPKEIPSSNNNREIYIYQCLEDFAHPKLTNYICCEIWCPMSSQNTLQFRICFHVLTIISPFLTYGELI